MEKRSFAVSLSHRPCPNLNAWSDQGATVAHRKRLAFLEACDVDILIKQMDDNEWLNTTFW
jgi:hypothetical protein